MNNQDIIKIIEERIENDRNAKNFDISEIELNLAFFNGDQWTRITPVSNGTSIITLPNPKSYQRYTINYIAPTIHSIMAKITAPNPIIKTIPKTGSSSDINAARIADYVAESEIWENFNMPILLQKIIIFLACAGSVVLRPLFNPNIGKLYKKEELNEFFGENIVEEDVREGKLELDILTRYELTVDPYAETDSEARWWIVERLRNKDWVYENYGKIVKPNKKYTIPKYYKQFKASVGNEIFDNSSNDMILIRELWEKPSKNYPEGLCFIYADDGTVLYNDKLPYGLNRFGILPFIKIDYETILGKFWGKSPVSLARSPQRQINRSYTQYMNHLNIYTHAPILSPIGNMVQKNHFDFSVPGNFIQYAPGMNNAGRPEFMQVPPINPQILNNISIMKNYIEDVFGLHEISKATAPAGVKTGRALSILDAADDTKIHPVVIQVENGISRMCQIALQIIEQTYNIPRIIKIAGKVNARMVKDFTGDKLAGNTDVKVKLRTPLPMNKMAAIETAITLWDRQIIPHTEDGLRIVHKMIEMEAYKPLLESTKDEEQAEFENSLLDEGFLGEQIDVPEIDPQTNQPKTDITGNIIYNKQYIGLLRNDWDIDEIHIKIHEGREKEIDFLDLIKRNPLIAKAYNLHITHHRNALLKKQELFMQQQLQQQQQAAQINAYNKQLVEEIETKAKILFEQYRMELQKQNEIEIEAAKQEILSIYNKNNSEGGEF